MDPRKRSSLVRAGCRRTDVHGLGGVDAVRSVRYGRHAGGDGQRAADVAELRVGAAGAAELELMEEEGARAEMGGR
jgi:hypothetical protein